MNVIEFNLNETKNINYIKVNILRHFNSVGEHQVISFSRSWVIEKFVSIEFKCVIYQHRTADETFMHKIRIKY